MRAVARTPQSLLTHLRYAFEALVVFFLYGFFWFLPLDRASAIGGFLARSVGPRLAASRKAHANLDLAFPEKPRAWKEAVVRGMWDNLGRVFAEYPHLHRLSARVEVVGREYIDRLRDDGMGGIFVGGHLANWEAQILAAKLRNLPLALVYRMPNNYWLENLLRHARDSGAAHHVPKGAAGARDMVAVLRGGGHLGLLVDQKLNQGIAVPFFGRDAMTAPFAAQLALKYNCPLAPVRVERLGGARFRVTILPPLDLAGKDDVALMTEINNLLEGWIRERPEQWLWLHRRWPEP